MLGISTDGTESHKKFAASLKLPFRLLADPEGKVSQLYGVRGEVEKLGVISRRAVFLVGKDGKVLFLDRKFAVPKTLEGSPLERAVREAAK